MTIQLKDIMGATRVVEVSFGDIGELRIEYSPAVATNPMSRAMLDFSNVSEDAEKAKRLAQFVVSVVAWWDLYDGDTPMAITVENVSGLPLSFLSAMLTAIGNDMNGAQK